MENLQLLLAKSSMNEDIWAGDFTARYVAGEIRPLPKSINIRITVSQHEPASISVNIF